MVITYQPENAASSNNNGFLFEGSYCKKDTSIIILRYIYQSLKREGLQYSHTFTDVLGGQKGTWNQQALLCIDKF
jgi:hypothetical protein